jgi:HAD superfamily phosphatase (TIGR01681 family)
MVTNKYKLIIFDLDSTLLNNYKCKLYDDVIYILDYLKNNKYKIALASYNINADEHLKRHNIFKYFDIIKFENWRKKYDKKDNMLQQIVSESEIEPNDILFIDDNSEIVSWAESNDFNVYKVNGYKGINIKELSHYIPNILTKYSDKKE